MKVKDLVEALQGVGEDLEIYSGNGDGYLSAVRLEDVNLRETGEGLIIAIEGQGNSAFLHEMEKKAEAAQAVVDKPLPLSALAALLRAYLNSLRTSFLYKEGFEELLSEESLGDEGRLSEETWESLLKELGNEWTFVKMGIGWSFSYRRTEGP